MFRKFVANFLSKKAGKFITAALGSAVTWGAAHGVPLDMWITDESITAIGMTVTTALVWAVKNVDT